jgi:hypothetical protein
MVQRDADPLLPRPPVELKPEDIVLTPQGKALLGREPSFSGSLPSGGRAGAGIGGAPASE